MTRFCRIALAWFLALAGIQLTAAPAPEFRAGAAAVDITPSHFPVIVNGGFLEKTTTNVTDRLHARALALDDGSTRLVLCVVDTCMMPRDLIDRAKELARQQTGLRTDRMLVSATHTHSAPSAMACLGSRADTNYVAFLPGKIAEAIAGALKNLQPARIGWASVDDWDHTFNRRWIRRPDKLIVDPYGQPTGRAHMHPGHQSPDAIGPSGPVDPELSILAVQTRAGHPLALLGNYSQHYFGASALSADYYGKFAEHIASLVAADVSRLTSNSKPETRNPKQEQSLLTSAATEAKFVGIMSQGTSGDLMWMDYAAPRRQINHDTYAREVADRAMAAYRQIEWRDWVPLKMAEATLPLACRVPDASRLAWARKVAASYSGRLPKDWPEVYANEALILHERQRTELVLQALRIGDFAIAALPNEVFAITGLKLKAQSPLKTFNIELANGAEGYIPPPEQHALGGYTTWAARTAGLETNAEPKIVEALLKLLEQVSDKPRLKPNPTNGPYAEAILSAKPAAYWRFEEMVFPTAKDATRNRKDATYEYGVALYLPGVGSGTGVSPKAALTPSAFSGPNQINRAAHFAGGRLKTDLRVTGKAYSVEFWLWNGLPVNLRPVTGILLTQQNGEQLGITGTNGQPGRLFYSTGANQPPQLVGKTELGLKQWHHVALVREGRRVSAFLDGSTTPEFSGELPEAAALNGLLLGGSGIPADSFEGRLDEVAVYDRALKPEEIAAHWKLSGLAAQRAAEAAEAVAQAAERERATRELAARANPPAFPPAYKDALLALKPGIYWPLTDAKGDSVPDLSGNKHDGAIESGVSLSPATFAAFNGGRIRASHGAPVSKPAPANADSEIGAPRYSVSFWFRNDLPNDSRPVTAYLFSRGANGDRQAPGDHLGIGGTHRGDLTGRLMFFNGNERNQVIAGRTVIPPGTWNHVVLVRDSQRVTAWLNGVAEAEFNGEADHTTGIARGFYLGARSDHFAPLQGYMAHFALFDSRALHAEQAKQLHAASGKVAGTSKASPSPPSGERAGVRGQVPSLQSPALSAVESIKKIHVPTGFRVELAAAEPLTMDPTAIDWDERERLWVVEMADYPLGMDGKGKAGGRVRVLEDVDGDGRYDKSTLFANGLNFPTGLLTWRDGVIVTAAPDILFLRDTNGDGRADERRVLFTGFFEGNQQLRVNGLRWGLDNWVYCANGGHHAGYGDKIKIASKITGKEIELGSRDFRFRPDTGEIEPESGPTQFGRNRDDWGNWFGTQNSWPLWHYVLPDRYLRRNPHLAAPSPVRQIITPGNPKVYPASALEKRFHSFDQSGRFTSACAGMIYRDELLFDRAYAHAFTCEPFHNLVQHNLLSDDGVSFNFRRAPEEAKLDFFASEDRWCRPVMTRTGPDGALWVVDMYRYMIEHPQWLPANGRDELLPHYREGDDKGRIYRVVLATSSKSKVQGSKFRVSPSQGDLGKASTSQLVAALDSPNGWVRDKMQQLLLWKGDKAALPLLEKAAFESASPLARLHALCTLDGLQALKPELVERALRDKHAGVRINALRLAETHPSPGVIAAAGKLANDGDPKVRLQLAFSLGEWQDAAASQALAELAIADHDDPFLRAAVLSSAVPHCAALVDAVLKAGDPARNNLSEPLLTLALGLNERGSLARLLEPILAPTKGQFSGAQLESFGRFLDLLARRKLALADLKGNHSSDPLILTHARAQTLLAFASTVAGDAKAPLADRAAAVGLLAREPSQRERALQLLGGWLTPQTPAEIQRVAVRSLALTGDDQVPARLLDHWPAASPETRATMLETFLNREPWTLALLESVKADRVSPLAFDAARRAQLQRHQSQRVRGLANQLFKPGASSRAQIVEQFRPALALKGDAPRGQAVYAKLCVSCHKLGNTGNEVGPDLRSVVEHPPEKLLTSILDPSSDVQPGFFAYTVTLKNGEELYGLITSEAGSSVTLKLADGSTRAIVRNDIETLRGSNLSLMPEGLEAGLSQQDMADLIAFLKAPR